jgi:hypothetical protein
MEPTYKLSYILRSYFWNHNAVLLTLVHWFGVVWPQTVRKHFVVSKNVDLTLTMRNHLKLTWE